MTAVAAMIRSGISGTDSRGTNSIYSTKEVVEALARRLRSAGFKVFLDKWNLVPGDPWQEALEAALQESATVAVFVGPKRISLWHNEELRAALEEAVGRRKGFRVIPVMLPGSINETVSGFLGRRTWVDFR